MVVVIIVDALIYQLKCNKSAVKLQTSAAEDSAAECIACTASAPTAECVSAGMASGILSIRLGTGSV